MSKQVFYTVIRLFLLLNILCFSSSFLFASGSVEKEAEIEPEIKVITDLQDRYTLLADRVPAISMFTSRGTSAVDPSILMAIDNEFARQMTVRGVYKPISIKDWLKKTYAKNTASSPFAFLQAIAAERYAVPLEGVIKSDVYRIGDMLFIHVSYYSISGEGFPVTIVRLFHQKDEISTVVSACLDELEVRLKPGLKRTIDEFPMKKIIINDFSTSYRRLVTLESGEFEFVETPFLEAGGTTLRQGDKFFSRIVSYAFDTSFMFKSMHYSDLSPYTPQSLKSTQVADYIIDGEVLFSDCFSLVTISLRDAKTGAVLSVYKIPFTEFSAQQLWSCAREIVSRIVFDRFPATQFSVIPELIAENGALYVNNQFIGWSKVEGLVLPRGRFRFDTGDYKSSFKNYNLDSFDLESKAISGTSTTTQSILPIKHSYFIFIDDKCHLYVDREGEYFWNLINRSGIK